MLKQWILIFIGGGLGSVLRSLAGRLFSFAGFPWGTFIVNVTGSFLIGFLYALLSRQLLTNDYRMMLIIGFCGGFTTFSTFSNESLHLMRSGQLFQFGLYVVSTMVICLLAVWLGDKTGQWV